MSLSRLRALSGRAVLLGCILFVSQAAAWVRTETPPWADGVQTLQVALDAQDRYVDGTTAAFNFQEAVNLWNSRIQRFQMTAAPSTLRAASGGDRINSVVMAPSIYGSAFGDNVLAVTVSFKGEETRSEADIIFNSNVRWSSYRGRSLDLVHDIQRVALHELGHFLGLGHPNENSQVVEAIMNSRIGDLAILGPDDRIGAAMLYGLRGPKDDLIPVVHMIFSDPEANPVAYGESVKLVCHHSGAGTFSFQWFRDGAAIPGANASTHTLPYVTTRDSGAYTLRITNEIGSTRSSAVMVSVSPPLPPEFSVSASDLNPTANYPFSLTAEIEGGTLPLTIRLERDGLILAESEHDKNSPTSFVWTFNSANSSHTGKYTYRITNAAGTVRSAPMEVIVRPNVAPVVLNQYPDRAVHQGEWLTILPQFLHGSPSATVKWEKDGLAIGSVGPLQISNFGVQDVGTYTYIISNDAGSTEGRFSLSLANSKLPWFKEAPEGGSFLGLITMTCAVGGTPPFTYEWKHNGRTLSNSNTRNPWRYSESADATRAGEYTVTVSNAVGSVTSPPVTWTERTAPDPEVPQPQIYSHPGSMTVRAGASTQFSTNIGYTADTQFQWYKDNVALPGKTSLILNFEKVEASDVGDYHLVATWSGGTLVTQKARLSIDPNASTWFAHSMGDRNVSWKNILYLVVSLNPGISAHVEWFQNGKLLPVTGWSAQIHSMEPANEGEYYARVTVGTEVVQTKPFRVRLIPPKPPASARLSPRIAEVGELVSFLIPLDPAQASHVQWKKNGVDIPGGTSLSLDLHGVTLADAGEYTAIRTNPGGTSEVSGGRLTVIKGDAPVFKAQLGMTWSSTLIPQASYQVESSTPITYRWKKNGVFLPANQPAPDFTGAANFTGTYTLIATNAGGSTESKPVELIDWRHQKDKFIASQPAPQVVTLGSSVNLVVQPLVAYPEFLWKKNGKSFATTSSGVLNFERATLEHSGSYSVSFKEQHQPFPIESRAAELRVLPYGRLFNVSSRASAGSNASTLIAGFTVSGPVPKQVLIRGIGPALTALGVANALKDPKIVVYNNAGAKVAEADSLDPAQREELEGFARRVGAFALDPESKDAPLLVTLPPGGYTVHLTAANGSAQGVGLVEVYDCVSNASRLINLSTRTSVGTGSDVLITGFVVEPGAPKKVLIRAAGPALEAFQVDGALKDPELEIVAMGPTQQTVAKNDNWDSTAAADIAKANAQVGAFAFKAGSRDAAVLVTLPPGGYTAIVSGKSGTSGVALVEVYEVVD